MGNNNIVTAIHPFVIEQEVRVYEEEECKKNVKCTLNELENVIIFLAKEFNVQEIGLGGNQSFALHLKEELMSKYAENHFNITIY